MIRRTIIALLVLTLTSLGFFSAQGVTAAAPERAPAREVVRCDAGAWQILAYGVTCARAGLVVAIVSARRAARPVLLDGLSCVGAGAGTSVAVVACASPAMSWLHAARHIRGSRGSRPIRLDVSPRCTDLVDERNRLWEVRAEGDLSCARARLMTSRLGVKKPDRYPGFHCTLYPLSRGLPKGIVCQKLAATFAPDGTADHVFYWGLRAHVKKAVVPERRPPGTISTSSRDTSTSATTESTTTTRQP